MNPGGLEVIYSFKKVSICPFVSVDIMHERVKRKHLSCEAGLHVIIRSEENFSKWQERKLGAIYREIWQH